MAALVFACLLLASTAVAASPASISWGVYPLKLSSVAPGNLLPSFSFQLSQSEGGALSVPIGGGAGTPSPFIPSDSCPLEIWDHASPDLHSVNLPYLTQDQWDCARAPTTVPVIVFEDAHLKLSITPQWGARIWSVHDKARGRDWTFANPAHQPANIAVLKAWTSGGIEWNWSPGIIGHSVFSESPAWVGVLHTPRGPVVRAWEFDRRNSSVWSVDIFLEGGALWVHPRVTNTHTTPMQGYWWTCVAVPAAPSSRVITPAEHTVDTSAGTQWATWPNFAMGDPNASFTGYQGKRVTDNSFLGAVTQGDFFMGPTMFDEHYIAWAEKGGFVGWHGHGESINGTKFFTWGQNGAGRFMQDFLGGISGPAAIPDVARVGDYTELQVGPAFTQMQTFDVPASGKLSWSEYFSAFQGDPSTLLGDSYPAALAYVNDWRTSPASGVNDTRIADVDAWLTSLEDTPPDEILHVGSPWGAVELARRASPGGAAGAAPFPRGVFFNVSRDATEAAPWLELVGSGGTFSPATLAHEPSSWQVSPAWLAVLRASAKTHGSTWLHDLFTAVVLTEMGGVEEPRALLNASLAKRPSALAFRCLAVLQPDAASARTLYRRAWALALGALGEPNRDRLLRNLGAEIVTFELERRGGEAAADAELRAFLSALPAAGLPSLEALDVVLVARATVALADGRWEDVVGTLTAPGAAGCFPTLASARDKLMDLWNGAQVARAVEANGGRNLSAWERRELMVHFPVPRNIGCPYGGGDGYQDCAYW